MSASRAQLSWKRHPKEKSKCIISMRTRKKKDMIPLVSVLQILSTPLLLTVLSCFASSSSTTTPTGESSNGGNQNSLGGNTALPTLKLRDGNLMPQVGLGVYRSDPGTETYRAVKWALSLSLKNCGEDTGGYRCLVDTAQMYENEESVGLAIQEGVVNRDEVFVTTKLDTDNHGYDEAIEAIVDGSLERLNTTYIDLMLIHSPYGEKIVETWDALVELQRRGVLRSIGVSNFGIPHLEALRVHGRPVPVVNQIEMHPLVYNERRDLIEYCRKHGIAITAYGSLFSGNTGIMDGSDTLRRLAAKHNKTVPQVLLRWALQHGFAVIPKSTSSRKRQEENLDLFDFELTPEEHTELSQMKGEPLDEYWNPVEDAPVDIGDLSHGGGDEL